MRPRHARRVDQTIEFGRAAFGHRLREQGLRGSVRRVGSSVDNTTIESFLATMQRAMLDTAARQHRSRFSDFNDDPRMASDQRRGASIVCSR